MPRFMCKLFNRYKDGGWSEVYPITATDYASCNTTFAALASLRYACFAPDVSLIGGVISDTDVKGDSVQLSTGITVGTWAGADTTSFDPNWALRILFTAGVSKRSSRFIHALPNAQVGAIGTYTPTGPFTSALSAFGAGMTGGVSIATKIPGATTPPFYTFTPLTNYTIKTMHEKKVGRFFGQPRGRRAIA